MDDVEQARTAVDGLLADSQETINKVEKQLEDVDEELKHVDEELKHGMVNKP